MDQDSTEKGTPPANVDNDEGLDDYDKELADSFPASDPGESTQP